MRVPQTSNRNTKIENNADGFDVVDPNTGVILASIKWRNVVRIETYKLDLLRTDCICLLFTTDGTAEPVEVLEEWQGFESMKDTLEAEFPSIPGEWFGTVMQPPFETNNAVLYEMSNRA